MYKYCHQFYKTKRCVIVFIRPTFSGTKSGNESNIHVVVEDVYPGYHGCFPPTPSALLNNVDHNVGFLLQSAIKIDRQAGRQTDRQTDRGTDKQKD